MSNQTFRPQTLCGYQLAIPPSLFSVVTLDASCSLIRDKYSYLRREYPVDQPQCRRVNILVCEEHIHPWCKRWREHIHPWCRRWRGLQLLWLFQLVELSFLALESHRSQTQSQTNFTTTPPANPLIGFNV